MKPILSSEGPTENLFRKPTRSRIVPLHLARSLGSRPASGTPPSTPETNPHSLHKRLRASGCIDDAPAISPDARLRSLSPAHRRYNPKDFMSATRAKALAFQLYELVVCAMIPRRQFAPPELVCTNAPYLQWPGSPGNVLLALAKHVAQPGYPIHAHQ
jgi:hypothetical protein